MGTPINTLTSLKTEDEDFCVEYEVVQVGRDYNNSSFKDELRSIDEQLGVINQQIEELDIRIDQYTNHADKVDYAVSVASGILTGLIDSFFVGEIDFSSISPMDFDKAKGKAHHMVNDTIMKYAKAKGYDGKGNDRLEKAIEFLEKKYKVPQDDIYKGRGIGVTPRDHHLADLAHHPTLIGLLASIVVQLFKHGVFVNQDGEWHFVGIETDAKQVILDLLPFVISGILNWLVYIAEQKLEDKLDEEIPKPIKAEYSV
ncbi:MAG: hypothetical protein IJ743_03280 [Bacilli bacterium]|nr:hypothetical protein [Bacilli bacterium]